MNDLDFYADCDSIIEAADNGNTQAINNICSRWINSLFYNMILIVCISSIHTNKPQLKRALSDVMIAICESVHVCDNINNGDRFMLATIITSFQNEQRIMYWLYRNSSDVIRRLIVDRYGYSPPK